MNSGVIVTARDSNDRQSIHLRDALSELRASGNKSESFADLIALRVIKASCPSVSVCRYVSAQLLTESESESNALAIQPLPDSFQRMCGEQISTSEH